MEKSNLGDRMKSYENCFKTVLPWRLPVIIRLDGKSFHTLTRNLEKPFDSTIIHIMNETARRLMIEIQGAKLAYVQSDEISILLYPWATHESQPWFGNEIQKLVSVSAGMASAHFTACYGNVAVFDSRVFILPEYDVVNYFIWRQQDWIRNSVSMLAQSLFSHKELQNKNSIEMKKMCAEKGKPWEALENSLKYGRCISRISMDENNKPYQTDMFHIDNNIPIFKDYRDYISLYLPTVTKSNFEYIAENYLDAENVIRPHKANNKFPTA